MGACNKLLVRFRYSSHDLNNEPFNQRTVLDHSNTELRGLLFRSPLYENKRSFWLNMKNMGLCLFMTVPKATCFAFDIDKCPNRLPNQLLNYFRTVIFY